MHRHATFFQVSTLSLHDIESKRGVQYKLCADTEANFDIWTCAIAEVINRKESHNRKPNSAPVLTHQQLYRQRLLQKQLDDQTTKSLELDTVASQESPKPIRRRRSSRQSVSYDGQTTPDPRTAVPPKRKLPPRIVTEFSSGMDSNLSHWHFHLQVDGIKQCLIVGFVLNIIAIRCLASEHVLWKLIVCIVVTCAFVGISYRPGLRGYVALNETQNPRLETSVSQCNDPRNCCLHKGLSPVDSNQTRPKGICRKGSDNVPRRRSVGEDNRHFTKLPMGSTMAQCEMLANGNSNVKEHSWATTRAETFAVRSSDYKITRKKQPSKPALFEFLGADLFRTESKIDLISHRIEFPSEHESCRLFIINAQLPSYGPSVWGDGSYDGPGYSLALYWKLPDDIIEALENPMTPALKLFKRFQEAGNDTSLTDRFKMIALVTNQDECGITGIPKKLLARHNATPVLTRPQHRIYHFDDGSTEIVVDVHAFSFIARRGIYSLLDKTSRLVIDLAFVIQGETEEELPEQVLGCCRLNHVNVQKAFDLPR